MLRLPRTFAAALLCVCALSRPCAGAAAAVAASPAEARAAHAFEEARKQGPPSLHAFLYRMPKGADLHMHLTGAVYAETWIREAGEDGDCVSQAKMAIDDQHHVPDCAP